MKSCGPPAGVNLSCDKCIVFQQVKSGAKTEFVPGFHFGYGCGDGPEDGVYRIEFSAEAFERKES